MHILEPHNWVARYGEPHSEAERQASYDKALAASDKMVTELLRPLTSRRPDTAPIVIVTADHGEALGEHGHAYHSTDLYNSQIRVPLVMAGPGIKPQRIDETVSLTDLVPTILELAGFQPPRDASIDGRSIASLATGRRASVRGEGTAFAAMIKDRSNPGGVTAIVKGNWKLVDDGDGQELYDLAVDPHEHFDLARTRPAIMKELRALLAARHAAARASPF
jgi:arylsulfatase A-like enzyme